MDIKYFENRNDIEEKYTWNLEKIYGSLEEFEKDFEKVKEFSKKILEYKGKLNDSNTVLNLFKDLEFVFRTIMKLMNYAHMKKDQDGSVTMYQGIQTRIEQFYYQFSAESSFIDTELISKDENFLNSLVNDEKLKEFKFKIQGLIRSKEHILSEEAEMILSMFGSSIDAPYNIAGIFKNVDLKFPKIINEDNKEVQLNEGNYGVFLSSKDRSVRKDAYEKLFSSYKDYKNTLATCLSTSITNDVLYSRAKKFNSSLESNLFGNNIDKSVYTNAIEVMHDNFDKIHRYIDLKKKMLKVDKLMSYDLYVPLFENLDNDIPYEKALEISFNALKPLGDEYLNIFKEAVDNRWIDVYTNKGKRSGAYSSGSYDTYPYILLNYSNSFNDVSTLVHEMGHSIHSYYSKNNQSFFNYRYPIFLAEIASTCNEHLLNKYMQDISKGNEKLYFVNKEIENIRTTVFRQMLFAEFELITHEMVENGKPLTSDDFCSIWKDLNEKYYGKSLVLDDYIIFEWSRIPHFYSAFYVYQYATGYAASFAFSQNILNEGNSAVRNYIDNFLKMGGSNYPIEILKDASVDMTTKTPMQNVMNRFSELLDILEKNI
ncbi:oligoendopeptidase F [Candidatus Arthromitus sp. SFB-turkey]|uniref:oligoendopeptidase F n=1 Tax=Candidatus Arthromitus sp. SFB-turkey TaxID=1840217 RepID=UPI0007F510C8|nr:oligoendopeptidase F [Candidatus Arthromitus sp. SFB-turkey]OAT88784.1 oligoendopeptidase F [Candidatus Arthromitus sp. SFB-turkey]